MCGQTVATWSKGQPFPPVRGNGWQGATLTALPGSQSAICRLLVLQQPEQHEHNHVGAQSRASQRPGKLLWWHHLAADPENVLVSSSCPAAVAVLSLTAVASQTQLRGQVGVMSKRHSARAVSPLPKTQS